MPSRAPDVLVVGCGFPQLGLLRSAARLGIRTLGVDANPRAVGVQETSEFEQASTADELAISSILERRGIRAIATSGSELALTTAARVAHMRGLPFYLDAETLHRCQAKDAMRAAYQAAGLPTPRFHACMNLTEAHEVAKSLGFPLVVKPSHGWGQRGVSRVSAPSQLDEAFLRARTLGKDPGGAIILEQHMEGHELSVNGWIEEGELVAYCVTDREVFPGETPLGVMRSEISPSVLDAGLQDAAIEAARRAARALGLLRGPCYTQVCVTPKGPVVFETAARCGGGFDADVTRLVSGVDLYARLLGVALADVSLEKTGGGVLPRHPAALVRFLAPPIGTISAVRGLEEALASPGVIEGALYASPGQHLEGLLHAASRVGHLLCVGDDRAQAVVRADAAQEKLIIMVA